MICRIHGPLGQSPARAALHCASPTCAAGGATAACRRARSALAVANEARFLDPQHSVEICIGGTVALRTPMIPISSDSMRRVAACPLGSRRASATAAIQPTVPLPTQNVADSIVAHGRPLWPETRAGRQLAGFPRVYRGEWQPRGTMKPLEGERSRTTRSQPQPLPALRSSCLTSGSCRILYVKAGSRVLLHAIVRFGSDFHI